MTSERNYMVIGRCTEGVKVNGYIIQDMRTGQSGLMDRESVERMALNKCIYNVTAQLYDNKVYMKGIDCKLSALPIYDSTGKPATKQNCNRNKSTLEIKARIINGKSIVGYVLALLVNGVQCSEMRVSRDQVIELAQKGCIVNARMQKSNDKFVLRGVNCGLAQLPSTK